MAKLNSMKARLAKEYGNGLFDPHRITKIPSGIFAFDYLTKGGIPQSRVVTFWGVKATGKTTTAIRIAVNYLKLNPTMRTVFVDFESAFDWDWAEHFIPEDVKERFEVITPDYGEQGVGIIKEVAQAEDVGLIIIDSITMMTPLGEYDADPEASTMTLHVRLVNRLYRYLVPIITTARKVGKNVTVIAINQPIMDIGKKSFAPVMKKTGGLRQECITALDIRFRPGLATKVGGVPVKISTPFTVEKTKCGGIAHRSGEFDTYLVDVDGFKVGDIDEFKTVMAYAIRTNLIVKEGNKWKVDSKQLVQSDWQFPVTEFASKADLLAKLQENPVLFESVKQVTLKRLYAAEPIEEGSTIDDGTVPEL